MKPSEGKSRILVTVLPMPLVDLFSLSLRHSKQELSRMKRGLCSISAMKPLSKRGHLLVRPGFHGEDMGPTVSP